MVSSTFFAHPKGKFLVLGGSEHLPGWLMDVLAHFGNIKKTDEKIGSEKVLQGAHLAKGVGLV